MLKKYVEQMLRFPVNLCFLMLSHILKIVGNLIFSAVVGKMLYVI